MLCNARPLIQSSEQTWERLVQLSTFLRFNNGSSSEASSRELGRFRNSPEVTELINVGPGFEFNC